jgi:RNA polymerase sigma-70 factor (ECF subfamily)
MNDVSSIDLSGDVLRVLRDGYETARAAWPAIDDPDKRFWRKLVASAANGIDPARRLHYGDLFLAVSCAARHPVALAQLNRIVAANVASFVHRLDRSPTFAEELGQLLQVRLVVERDAGGEARIAQYSGRGTLLGWLRVVATRTALNLLQGRHHEPTRSVDDETVARLGTDELEQGMFAGRYRSAFEGALREALGTLPTRSRRVLRLSLVGGLSTTELGKVLGVNQSTAVRWLAHARTELRATTKELLAARFGLETQEFDEVSALVLSQLDVSVAAHLKTHA